MKFKIFKHTLAAFRFDHQVLSFHSAFTSKSALFKPRLNSDLMVIKMLYQRGVYQDDYSDLGLHANFIISY
jgi:hypothetical protein